eukprot:237987_1
MLSLHVLLSLLCISAVYASGHQQWLVNISSTTSNNFYYYWNKCVGSGHGSLLLREDWRSHMEHGRDKINFTHVRCHGILDDDVGSVNNINDYSFVNIDKIYSYLLSINMKPYVEISFMPEKLASDPTKTTCHYKGGTSPPSSYDLWHTFIQTWIQHLVDYFGIDEIRQWKFEVWNEPNLPGFWQSNYAEYLLLYNATATAIKSVDKYIEVGGPTTAVYQWLDEFLNDVLSHNIPIDFVVTHSYPNQLNLQNINTWIDSFRTQGIGVVEKYNAKYGLSLPLVISEYNSGCCIKPFDEGKFMNDDNFYAAAFLIFWAKHLQVLFADGDVEKSTLKWMSYWAISDVFEESGFNSNEFNNLYGLHTVGGIPKPAFRAFELLHQLGSEVEYAARLVMDDNGFDVSNSTLQVYCLKNGWDEGRYSVFVANWNNYGFNITQQHVVINISNAIDHSNELQSALMYRIDEDNTAPLARWIAMGSPKYLSEKQLEALNVSSQLKGSTIEYTKVDDNTLQFELLMPVYGVAVLDLHY